ncbi:MAG: ABC transporter ATP-binding protein [Cellvibrionaceae bacterium]
MSSPIITLNDLSFRWSAQAAPTISVAEWHIDKGQSIFLYGRSGSGKSTLLNILAGILQPEHGSVDILGKDLVQMSQQQKDRFRAQHIGVIFQQFNLIPYMSVSENIQLSQYFAQTHPDKSRVSMLLNQLGLDDSYLNQKASQLSVGQQQRVAVARALYHQPEIIIADEPTSALDAETRDEFIKLLLEQAQTNNSTILFVSHDKSLQKHFDHSIDLQDLNQSGAVDHAI